jgi:hypothetical protein
MEERLMELDERVVVVSPTGFRVEGLDLSGAATLLRLLG